MVKLSHSPSVLFSISLLGKVAFRVPRNQQRSYLSIKVILPWRSVTTDLSLFSQFLVKSLKDLFITGSLNSLTSLRFFLNINLGFEKTNSQSKQLLQFMNIYRMISLTKITLIVFFYILKKPLIRLPTLFFLKN